MGARECPDLPGADGPGLHRCIAAQVRCREHAGRGQRLVHLIVVEAEGSLVGEAIRNRQTRIDSDLSNGKGDMANYGRGHNPYGFTTILAGGGVKGGLVHGATDEYGYRAVEGKVHLHDLHATILHLLGLDHEKLTYRHAGRDFRLTDVYGHVVEDILA